MPTPDDRAQWRDLAQRADRIGDAARDDPYAPRLAQAASELAAALADLPPATGAANDRLEGSERELLAATEVAAGEALWALNRSAEALSAFEGALARLESLASLSKCQAAVAAQAQVGLGKCLVDLGRQVDAIPVLDAAIGWYGTGGDPADELQQSLLSQALHTLGMAHADTGDHERALQVTSRAVELRERLAAHDVARYQLALSRSLRNLGNWLGALKRTDAALPVRERTAALRREARQRRPTVSATLALAQALETLAQEFPAHPQALASLQQVTDLHRELAGTHRGTFLPDLVKSLDNLRARYEASDRSIEAQQLAAEAAALRRELAGRDAPAADDNARLSAVSSAAVELANRAIRLRSEGQRAPAVEAAQEAVNLLRGLLPLNRDAVLPLCARALNIFGVALGEAGRRAEALAAAEEALVLRRELAAANRGAFLPDLATSLNNFGNRLSEAGRRAEALAVWREAGACALELRPDDPYLWSALCRAAVRGLDTAQDLRDFHLRLLGLLTEHRELAWNSEHARVFLDLQAEVAARVWELLRILPAEQGELLDEAVAALVAALQSPDLARWLDARGGGDGPLAKLAELKREVIEAEQLLAALRKGLVGGEGGGMRTGAPGPGLDEQRAALSRNLEHQSAKAQALRQAFRDERARLTAEDPRFAAAFQPLGPQTLRSIAGHAQGTALLCMLQLGGNSEAEPSSAQAGRTVAALLHAGGRRTQLLELAEVPELAWHAERYTPEAGDRRRGPLRGAPPDGARAASTEPAANGDSPATSITELLAGRMSRSFWSPLQQALHESGVAIERLHVCLHGTTQQLPLALRQDSDCPGVQIVPWPGLPYLRRAAMAAGAATATDTANAPPAPWLVGHDCAWASEQPLPMVAVEAALLRDLLQRHGQPVQAVQLAAQLHGRASALVACCHGGAEQAQFDHALHLGSEPLTVRRIVNEHLGPPLALLPACHAGRTDEDAAGNALGVAAAFMLSGTKVVAASSKAVPDLLQPWLSTLTVWHAMQGLPHHEAATLAREQFARLDFPEGYRSWLQQSLPQALATIQPGGEEDQHIRGPHAHLALETVATRWPWESDAGHLFHADSARRDEAKRSVVHGILRPRGGEEGARALAAETREMAAFVFVYGVDG